MPSDFLEITESKAEFIERKKTYVADRLPSGIHRYFSTHETSEQTSLLPDKLRYFSTHETSEQTSHSLRRGHRIFSWRKYFALTASRISTPSQDAILAQKFRSFA